MAQNRSEFGIAVIAIMFFDWEALGWGKYYKYYKKTDRFIIDRSNYGQIRLVSSDTLSQIVFGLLPYCV